MRTEKQIRDKIAELQAIKDKVEGEMHIVTGVAINQLEWVLEGKAKPK